MLGVLAVLALALGFLLYCSRPNDDRPAVLRQAATQIAEAKQARAATTLAIADAKATARAVEGEAKFAMSRAAAARARAQVVGASDVRISATPNAAPLKVRVPTAVVEAMQLDSTAVAALSTVVRWKDTVIVRLDQRIAVDSVELLAASNAFHALLRMKEPRCGRRCGIVLGVGGMLVAAVAVEQVRRAAR
jgi:hypothetical protein